MRKVFLDGLPKFGAQNKVNWERSIGRTINFIYDDVKGNLEIVGYKKETEKLLIKYKNSTKEINATSFKKGLIGRLIGAPVKIAHTYSVGETVNNLEIIEQITFNSKGKRDAGYKYNCLDCGNTDVIKQSKLKSGRSCNVCRNSRKVVKGINDLWTTHPEHAIFLNEKEDGYKISKGSHKEINFKCPDCNLIQPKKVSLIIKNGFSCVNCSDGISYPEKMVKSILDQLGETYVWRKTFHWSKGKEYDFFIPSFNLIIETHGMQHYEETNRGRSLKEEMENDLFKENLAKENGVDRYITIDCRYSDLQFIKANIIKSELKKILNVERVDWILCHKNSVKSITKTICDYWNMGIKSALKISEKVSMSRFATVNHLKSGSKFGWCDYNPELAHKKMVVKLSLDNYYLAEYSSIKEASLHNNLNKTYIGKCIKFNNGINSPMQSGGYIWYEKRVYESYKNNLKKYKKPLAHNAKAIVQLNLKNYYIKEYETIQQAADALNLSQSKISIVCSGKRNQTGGYKWMYKEDYDKYIKEQQGKELITT